MEYTEEWIYDKENTVKRSNIHFFGVPAEEESKDGAEIISSR